MTIQTCWDADRLDLIRAGITPDPNHLCTAAAKEPKIIRWANARSKNGTIPEFVHIDWLAENDG